MKMKKILIITLFLLSLFMISTVCAANNDTLVSSNVNDDAITGTVLAQDDAKAVKSSDDEPILKEDYGETSFKALNRTINEADSSEIELDKNYTYNGSSDSELKNGIIINKSLTIDGKGKTINGNSQARIFNITAGAIVTIKNLNFVNGNADYGGAIYVDNGNLTITDSNLTNNKASKSGGAIYIKTGTVTLNNVKLTNNEATNYGGAIYKSTGQLTVINSLFESNVVKNDGGAIRDTNDQLTVIKSTFKGNKASERGGGISSWSNINITECLFENNEAGVRGGAIHSRYTNSYQHVSYSNFTNNTAKETVYESGGALCFLGYLNATGNIFTNNHDGKKETIDLVNYENGIFVNNTYVSTDIAITGLTLSLTDGRTAFNATEDIILSYNIALKHPDYYKDIKTGLRGITLYIDGENRTTLYEDITLSNLKPGPHTAYFTILDYESDRITFYVFNESQISTPEASYEYAEGTNTKIPLVIVDKSDMAGTINITVKDQDSYKLLSTIYNVKNGYKISTAALVSELENMYDTLDSSYTINITYSSEYGYPSSTEFTLNIINERNTTIIYNIINNTEGNLQINITVQDAVTKTPIPGAIIEITGDIIENTVSGIITNNTLTAGEYTITVRFPETGNYKASQTTIKFNVEIDKDKKIAELTSQISDLQNYLESVEKELTEANYKNKKLEEELQEAKSQIETLQNNLNNNQTALTEALNQIKTLNETLQNNITALEKAQNQINTLQNNLENNITALEKAQNQINTLQNNLENNITALEKAQNQINTLQNNLENNITALENALTEIQSLKDSLGMNQTAEKIIETLQNNLKNNQTALKEAQKLIETLQNNLNNNITALQKAQNNLENNITALQKAQNQITTLEQELKDNITALQKAQNNLENNITALQKAQNQITTLEQELKDNITALEKAQNQIKTLNETLQNNITALQEAKNKIETLEQELKDNITALENALTEIQSLKDSLGINQTADKIIEALKNNLKNNQTALKEAQNQINTLQTNLENNITALQEAQNQINTLQNNLNNNQTALKEAQNQINTLQNNLNNNQTALQQAQSQISILNGQINTLNDQITNLKNQQNKVTPKVTKILANKKTFKSKVKVKKYTITLKTGNNAIPNVKVSITINGKTYSAKTNSKGTATFKITKLTKKGSFKATVTYKGNANYKASKKTVQIIIK